MVQFCKHCGRELNSGSHFCTGCGTKVDSPQVSKLWKLKETEGDLLTAGTSEINRETLKSVSSPKNKTILMAVISIIGITVVVISAFFISNYLEESTQNGYQTASNIERTTTNEENASISEEEVGNEEVTTNNNESKINENSSEFILPKSDSRRISEGEIASLTIEQLRLARNEIYARRGYIFNSEDLRTYFSNKSWYYPNTSYDGTTLNEIEKYNVEVIQNRERYLK